MKGLDAFKIELAQCLSELAEFEKLLDRTELGEDADILPFFKARLHLSAFVASYVPQISRFDELKHEFNLFGDFRSDLVVGDSINNSYCFIEFEDATRDSIFYKAGRSTLEWSPRFEHGFSQLVDRFWKLDDLKNTSQFGSIFGHENIEYYGMLVIGRDAFLSNLEKMRLKWRLNRVLVDSRKIVCITFDQLARDIKDRLRLYSALIAQKQSVRGSAKF
jgi:hypothetical protein